MLETIAMWGGVAGCALALVAIIAILLVKMEIKHLLNRDNILFNQNFELKKQAIENALSVVDELEIAGDVIINSPDFSARAKNCYNQLLCVTSKMNLAEEFYAIAIENITPVTATRIAKFKVACRKDIGLSTRGSKLVLRANARIASGYQPGTLREEKPQSYVQPQQTFNQPVQPQQNFVQPAQPVQRPMQQPGVRPMQRPIQPQQRPAQPMQNPVRPVANQAMRKTDHD